MSTVYTLSVPFRLSLEQLNLVNKLHPAYLFEGEGNGTSLHPILHCERALIEDWAIRMVDGPIIDIGGNAARHLKYCRQHIHSCCPLLKPQDVFRNQRYHPPMRWCEHLGNECCCSPGSVGLMVHSAYYFSQSEMLELLMKYERVLVVVHKFCANSGSFHGEATYNIRQDTVTMYVDGCLEPYVHSNLDWLYRSSSFEACGQTMVWNLLTSVGSASLVEFRKTSLATERNSALKPLPMGCTFQNALPDGTIRVGMTIQLPGVLTPIPLAFYKQLCLRALGLRKDMQCYVALTAYARSMLLRGEEWHIDVDKLEELMPLMIKSAMINMSITEKPHLLEILTSLELKAFNSALEGSEEPIDHALMGAIKTRFGKFGYATLIACLHYMGYSTYFKVYRWIIYYLIARKDVPMWLRKLLNPPPLFLTVIAVLSTIYFFYSIRIKAGLKTIPFRVRMSAIICQNSLKKLKQGSMFRLLIDTRRPRMLGCIRYGPCTILVPQVHADTLENEQLALVNRGLSEALPAQPGVWADHARHVLDHVKTLFPGFGPVQAVEFNLWNSRFEPVKRAANLLAYRRTQLGYGNVDLSTWCSFEGFLKREKLLKDCEWSDPRLIQGIKPEIKVLTGPWYTALGVKLIDMWPATHCIMCAPGRNANQLGRFVRNPAALYLSGDIEKCDKNKGVDCQEAEIQVFSAFSPPAVVLKVANRQIETNGITSRGIKYRVLGTTKSGSAQTTIGNTITIGLLVHKIMIELYGQEYGHLLIGGDDFLIELSDHVKTSIPAILDKLLIYGMAAKFNLDRPVQLHDAIFYSGVFYPTSTGYVLTPLIGKTLSKCFWSLVPQGKPLAWVYSNALAYSQTFSHIPFMVYFFRRVMALSVGHGRVTVDRMQYSVEKVSQCTDETTQALFDRYALTLADYEEFSSIVASMNLDTVLKGGLISKVLRVDCMLE